MTDANLAQDLVTASVIRGHFVLRSGATSTYYIDKYLFTTVPGLLRRLADHLAHLLPTDVQRIAGTELGAVPLATALSLSSGVPMVIVRKASKSHGTTKAIEGQLVPGDRVVLVEDIVTTGGAVRAALATLRAAHVEVVLAIAVVDRQEGGAEALAADGVPLQALFTRTQLEAFTRPL